MLPGNLVDGSVQPCSLGRCRLAIRHPDSVLKLLLFHGEGHALALDLSRTELFCLECRDYVYSDGFDRAVSVSGVRVVSMRRLLPC